MSCSSRASSPTSLDVPIIALLHIYYSLLQRVNVLQKTNNRKMWKYTSFPLEEDIYQIDLLMQNTIGL